MQELTATNISPSERIRRGMRRVALVVAVPAFLIAMLLFGLAAYTRDVIQDYAEYIAVTQIAQPIAALAIGWFVLWITLSLLVRGFMKD